MDFNGTIYMVPFFLTALNQQGVKNNSKISLDLKSLLLIPIHSSGCLAKKAPARGLGHESPKSKGKIRSSVGLCGCLRAKKT